MLTDQITTQHNKLITKYEINVMFISVNICLGCFCTHSSNKTFKVESCIFNQFGIIFGHNVYLFMEKKEKVSSWYDTSAWH